MSILQAIILGIVEGVTEFLPISSTGHLILVGKWLGIESSSFSKSFSIAIQLGAILAVVVLYWQRFLKSTETWKKVLIAFIPTGIIGFLLYRVIKDFFLSSEMLIVWSLLIGGILLIIFELWHKKRVVEGEITLKKSFAVGVIQAISAIPGVSRAGATIVGGLLMGIKREIIVEFSFLLAVPTMAAATGYDLYKSAGSFSFSEFYVLAIGFVVSFVVAILSIKWLIHFVKNHTFISFGVYRIIVAGLFYFLVIVH